MTTRKHWRWLAPMSLLALAPTTVSAHPIDTLRQSSEVYLANGWWQLDDRAETMSSEVISKAAGSLAVDLPFGAVDLDIPGTVHLTGTRHGDEIWWDFDQPVDASIDDFNWTRRIEGRLITGVYEMLPSRLQTCAAGPCPYSIYLDGVDRGSWARLHGTTTPFFEWSEFAEIGIELYAGPPRPRLESVRMTRRGGVCAADGDRRYTAEIVVDNPALAGGAAVEVFSSDPAIEVPGAVRVPQGLRRGTFSVDVPSGYTGTFELVGAAGGIQLHRSVSIGAAMHCLAGNARFDLDDFEGDVGCRGCLSDLQLGADGVAVGTLFDEPLMRDSDGFIVSLADLVGLSILDVLLADHGDLVMQGEDEQLTYVLARTDLGLEPHVLPDFDPVSIGADGVIAGAWTPQGMSVPALARGGRLSRPQVGLDEAVIDGVTPSGIAFGRLAKGGGVFLSDGEQWWSPKFAEEGASIAAINSGGLAAGTGGDSQWPMAYIAKIEDGYPIPIEDPQGYATEAMGLSEAGVVVVNRREGPEEPAGVALYSLEEGMVPLEEVLGELAQFVTVEEVLRVNQAFDLVVRGTIDGDPAIFGLRNIDAWGGEG